MHKKILKQMTDFVELNLLNINLFIRTYYKLSKMLLFSLLLFKIQNMSN